MIISPEINRFSRSAMSTLPQFTHCLRWGKSRSLWSCNHLLIYHHYVCILLIARPTYMPQMNAGQATKVIWFNNTAINIFIARLPNMHLSSCLNAAPPSQFKKGSLLMRAMPRSSAAISPGYLRVIIEAGCYLFLVSRKMHFWAAIPHSQTLCANAPYKPSLSLTCDLSLSAGSNLLVDTHNSGSMTIHKFSSERCNRGRIEARLDILGQEAV